MTSLSPSLITELFDTSRNHIDKGYDSDLYNDLLGYDRRKKDDTYERKREHDHEHEDKEWYEKESGIVYIGAGVAGLIAILFVLNSVRK